MKYRILTNGSEFKVQRREWWYPLWANITNYPYIVARTFLTLGDAEEFVVVARRADLETKRRNTWTVAPK